VVSNKIRKRVSEGVNKYAKNARILVYRSQKHATHVEKKKIAIFSTRIGPSVKSVAATKLAYLTKYKSALDAMRKKNDHCFVEVNVFAKVVKKIQMLFMSKNVTHANNFGPIMSSERIEKNVYIAKENMAVYMGKQQISAKNG
jgi:hypothetical protein